MTHSESMDWREVEPGHMVWRHRMSVIWTYCVQVAHSNRVHAVGMRLFNDKGCTWLLYVLQTKHVIIRNFVWYWIFDCYIASRVRTLYNTGRAILWTLRQEGRKVSLFIFASYTITPLISLAVQYCFCRRSRKWFDSHHSDTFYSNYVNILMQAEELGSMPVVCSTGWWFL
jgi:hypothetical protein